MKLVRVQGVEEMNEIIPRVRLDFVSDNRNRLSNVRAFQRQQILTK